ncbi:ankyrin repeat domain-containing protein [Catenovulum sp. SX2]|uniref:ankyrin repeat domain-containing protein n=1 Tax=Catenovulum sp. SX2 TaxID=3398614 RepID=UPI003F87E653
MNRYKGLLLALLVSFQYPLQAANNACLAFPNMQMPEWVMNPGIGDESKLYGVGSASATQAKVDFFELKRQSHRAAMLELSESLQLSVRSSLALNQSLTNINGDTQQSQLLDGVMDAYSDVLLHNSKVESIWFSRESCQLWTRVSVVKADFEQTAVSISDRVNNELAKLSEQLTRIENAVMSDPNVILRQHQLQLNSQGYWSALKLKIDKDEWFAVLDLFDQYGMSFDANAFNIVKDNDLFRYLNRHSFYLASGNDLTVLHYIALHQQQADVNLSWLLEWASARGKLTTLTSELANLASHSGFKCGGFGCYKGDLLRFRNKLSPEADSYQAIHFAAIAGSVQSIEIFVANGTPIYKQTRKGYTPLALAIDAANQPVVEYLLQQPDSLNQDLGVALEVAMFSAFRGLDSFLLNKNANFVDTFPAQITFANKVIEKIRLSQPIEPAIVHRVITQVQQTIERCNDTKLSESIDGVCNLASKTLNQYKLLK